jgi:hypothetical protein
LFVPFLVGSCGTSSDNTTTTTTTTTQAAKSNFVNSSVASAHYDLYWWQPLGSGLGGSLVKDSLMIDNSGNLYAGGYFTTAGEISCNYIAKWGKK